MKWRVIWSLEIDVEADDKHAAKYAAIAKVDSMTEAELVQEVDWADPVDIVPLDEQGDPIT